MKLGATCWWTAALAMVSLLWAQGALAQTLATSAALQVRLPSGGNANLPLVDEDIDVVIDQQHATTKLRHMYHNDRGAQLEGRFVLRAGGEAMVHGFAYWNGEEKIVGEVFEKALATKIYDDTVSRKRDPGLLTKTGEGIFSFKVFPIAAGEHKRVEMRVDQWLSRTGDTIEYRVPVRRGDADVRIELIDSRTIGKVVSTSHKLDVERRNGRVIIKSDGVRGTRNELVVRYQVVDKPWTMASAVHRNADHDGYLMLSVAAPKSNKSVPKDITLVIDRSGSMLGAPLTNAKRAASHIVGQLREGDRFNVLMFDDGVDTLFNRPKKVTSKSQQRGLKFIDVVGAGGGTNIALALKRAFEHQHNGKRPKTVIFLTDGKSDSQDALKTAKADRGDVRVFTVGLGDKVEKPLLSRLAAEKRGTFTFVESAATLKTRMAKLYKNISAPALVGLSLRLEGEDASLYRVYPRTLPDVFNGDELRIVSRVQGKGDIKVVLSGRTADGDIRIERTVKVPATVARSWVGRLWARSRVDHLLEEMALHGETGELKSETRELGLAYNLLTPYTAFLAIPEAELSANGREMLASARQQREEALAFNPDAAALSGAPVPGSAPESKFEGAYERDVAPRNAPEEANAFGGRGGCAGCSVDGSGPDSGDGLTWLALAFALSRLRRRRE